MTTPTPDIAAARRHFEMLAKRAEGLGGAWILRAYGEGLPPRHLHVANGATAVDELVQGLVTLSREDRNVYLAPCLYREDLAPASHGKEDEIAAVLAVVLDFDDPDKGAWPNRVYSEPDFVLETSSGHHQCFYILERPATVAEAKPVIAAAIKHAGSDESGKDAGHIWRIAGTIWHPTAKKIAKGRSTEPFRVRIVQPWDGTTTPLHAIAPAAPADAAPVASQGSPQPASLAAPVDAAPIDLASLPNDLRDVIVSGVPIGEDRSKAFFAVVADLKERRHSADAIGALLTAHPCGIAEKYSTRLLGKEVARAFAKVAPRPTAAQEFTIVPGERPEIRINQDLYVLATLAEQALIAAGKQLYQRAGKIVQPIAEKASAADGRETTVARLGAVTVDVLLDYMSEVARWTKWNAKEKAWVDTKPPRDVAAIILSRAGRWEFDALAGITNTATIRPDGSLLLEPGYDAATMLLMLDPPAMPPIPDKPTKIEAERALACLDDLLEEFPFKSPAAKSVARSGIMTAVIRGAIPVAPLHSINAPCPSSGKSYLVDIIATIATGFAAPVMSPGESEGEFEKRIHTAIIDGGPICSIDNANNMEIGGQAICQVTERPKIFVRPLGQSTKILCDSRITWCATGNNIRFVEDMTRRVLVCGLDPNTERPELRQFRAKPLEKVLADRGKYVAAVLTIVRAYAAAEFPGLLPPVASYDGWSRFVRSPLHWLGCADPLETMAEARAEDPGALALQEFVQAWAALVEPGTSMFAAELIRLGDGDFEPASSAGADGEKRGRLAEAMREVATRGHSGTVDVKALGMWLAQHSDKVVDGYKLRSRSGMGKKKKWTLVPLKAGAGLERDQRDKRDLSQRLDPKNISSRTIFTQETARESPSTPSGPSQKTDQEIYDEIFN